MVYSTGNGSPALIGWTKDHGTKRSLRSDGDKLGGRYLQAFAYCPPLGRGISWAVDGSWLDDEEYLEVEQEYD